MEIEKPQDGSAEKRKLAASDDVDAKKSRSSEDGNKNIFLAKVVQLKKPTDKTNSKVVHGIMEVLEGEFKGLKGFFQGSNGYVWGHSLSRANLMYNIRPGDVFTVEAYRKTVTSVYGNVTDTQDIPLVFKKCWLAIQSEEAQSSSENVEFSSWLSDRDLTEHEFKKWIQDRLPPKPYFPLQSELYDGELVSLIRDTPKCEGGLVKITDGPLKDKTVLFEREDFYVCGVHVGSADLRMLLRPGDKVSLQVQFMTGRERQLKGKKYPVIEEQEVNYTALLAFIGNKRPRGPKQLSKESTELRDFLEKLGLDVEEFEGMRSAELETTSFGAQQQQGGIGGVSSTQPHSSSQYPPGSYGIPSLLQLPPFYGAAITAWSPHMPVPADIPPMGAGQLEQLAKCGVVIARAIVVNQLKEETGNIINVGEIIETEEDVENAIKMGKWLTEAIIAKMQTHLQDKVKTKLGPNFGSILSTQKKQIEAAVTAMTPQVQPPGRGQGQGYPDGQQQQQQPIVDSATLSLIEQQNIAKKLLESDKRAVKQMLPDLKYSMDASGKDRRRQRTPELEPRELEEEMAMSPLELIRKYVILKRRIREGGSDKTIVFGDLRYPKDMKVNFRISNSYELTGGPKEYYTLECLYFFARNLETDHSLYVRRALTDAIPVVRKPDRDILIQYLTGKMEFCPNVENITFSELNPGMVLPEQKISSRREREQAREPRRESVAPMDSISQAIQIVSEKMSKIDPEAGEKWKEEPGSAIEKWKAKNNLNDVGNRRDGDGGARRDGNRRSNERSRSDQQQGFPSRINPFETNPGFNPDQFAGQRKSKFDEPPFQGGGNQGQNMAGNGILGNAGFSNMNPGNMNFNPGNMNMNMMPGNMNMNPGNMNMNPGNMNMNPGNMNMNPGNMNMNQGNMNMNQGNMPGNLNPGQLNMNMNPGNMNMNQGNMNQDRPGLGPMFTQSSQSKLW